MSLMIYKWTGVPFIASLTFQKKKKNNPTILQYKMHIYVYIKSLLYRLVEFEKSHYV